MAVKTGFVVPAIAACAMMLSVAAQENRSSISARRMFMCDPPACGQATAAPPTAAKAAPKSKSVAKPATSSAPPLHSTAGAEIMPAVAAAKPLALRYRILDPDHHNAEVSAEMTFHANEHIQLAVETNSPGYLYVINQGSSGQWTPMFPRADINNGKNSVEPGRVYYLPSEEHGMRFDEHTGTEHLVIALSRVPVPDLEEFIYSLKPEPPGQPVAGKQIVAQARIDNSTVERLKTVMSRDLIVEKITPETPADRPAKDAPPEKKETAVYVANPTGRPDSQLIAEIRLVHR